MNKSNRLTNGYASDLIESELGNLLSKGFSSFYLVPADEYWNKTYHDGPFPWSLQLTALLPHLVRKSKNS